MEKTLLVIDNREVKIKELLTDVGYVFENLDVGDFVIKIDDVDFIIFERKTISDLVSSILDGRYSEQKQRLLLNYSTTNIYYIIEGSFDFHPDNSVSSSIPKKNLVSCIINTMIRDHIKIFFTKNCLETCELIKAIYTRIQSDPKKYLEGFTPSNNVPKSKKITTKHDCYIAQLCQVPDVSTKTAIAIAQKYPSFEDLILTLKEMEEVQKLKTLKELVIKDNKGKARKISEKVAKNIIAYI